MGEALYAAIQSSQFDRVCSYCLIPYLLLTTAVQFTHIWQHAQKISLLATSLSTINTGAVWWSGNRSAAWIPVAVVTAANVLIYGGRRYCRRDYVLARPNWPEYLKLRDWGSATTPRE